MSLPFPGSVSDESVDSLQKGNELESTVSNVITIAGTIVTDKSRESLDSVDACKKNKIPQRSIVEGKRKCDKLPKLDLNECDLNDTHASFSTVVSETPLSQVPKPNVLFRSKESNENSPFKEAVKGFMLSKFGKKLGTQDSLPASSDIDKWTILSGIKEKISKSLEDRIGRDSTFGYEYSHEKLENSALSVGYTSSELQAKIIKCKHSENVLKAECELKSVVANDLTESSVIEEAHECFEGLKEPCVDSFCIEHNDVEDMSDNSQPPSPLFERKSSHLTCSTHTSRSPEKKKGDELSMSFSSLKNSKEYKNDSVQQSEESPAIENAIYETSSNDNELIVEDTTSFSENISFLGKLASWKGYGMYMFGLLLALCVIIPECLKLLKSPFWAHFFIVFLAIVVCWIWPISSFSAGFLNGALISSITVHFYVLLTRKSQPKMHLISPDYNSLPPLKILASSIKKSNSFEGWMNKTKGKYNSEAFRNSDVISVYAQLNESYLRLCYPKNNVPRRAMWNEEQLDTNFIQYTHHFLHGAKVMIVPHGLEKIRIWNKKYPICLLFPTMKTKDIIPSNVSDENIFKRGNIDLDKNLKAKSLPSSLSGSPAHQGYKSDDSVIYLFARTDRDKEEWYWRFFSAAQRDATTIHNSKSDAPQTSSSILDFRLNASPSVESTISDPGPLLQTSGNVPSSNKKSNCNYCKRNETLSFDLYMATLLGHAKSNFQGSPSFKKGSSLERFPACNIEWLNMLLGRLFYDFLTQESWSVKVKQRIQKQLGRVKLPSYMAELQVTDIYLGNALPQLRRTSTPIMDNRGLWLDFDIEYSGGFQMTLETKLDLTKAKRSESPDVPHSSTLNYGASTSQAKSSVEKESSSDSSDDDEIGTPEQNSERFPHNPETSRTGQKIFKAVEWCLHSRYFQNMKEFKCIRKAMEGVASTPIVLTVEVHGLIGTLAINVPPLPTDRLWYGFRKNPELSLSAYPKLGAREISYAHITNLIEKQLLLEFQKILVMPNMDDVLIPFMFTSVYDNQ